MPVRFFLVLLLAIMLMVPAMAFAQTDDDDDDNNDDNDDDSMPTIDGSYLEFDAPVVDDFAADTELQFDFTVYNAATSDGMDKAEWINKVELTMPSAAYVVNEDSTVAPMPLERTSDPYNAQDYPDRYWDVAFSTSSTEAVITWQCFGVVTSESYGDIRDGEALSFMFVATTDSDGDGLPPDGFPWVLEGDQGTEVNGTAYIGTSPEEDDDDDTPSADDDDDDDDSGSGCGC